MSKRIPNWLIVFVLPVLFSACYPKSASYVDELDLVYTNFSADFDFRSRTTYSMPDSIIKITGDIFNDPDGDGKPTFLDPALSKAITDQIAANMTAFGWTRVNKHNNPGVVLLISTMTTTNIYYYYDWWYWGWYYPGWNPGWGWYYPGWYYPTYITGYRSGSVFIQMADNQAAQTEQNVPIVWNVILNGLAEGSTSSITSRVQRGIDQAFAQSPYLRH